MAVDVSMTVIELYENVLRDKGRIGTLGLSTIDIDDSDSYAKVDNKRTFSQVLPIREYRWRQSRTHIEVNVDAKSGLTPVDCRVSHITPNLCTDASIETSVDQWNNSPKLVYEK